MKHIIIKGAAHMSKLRIKINLDKYVPDAEAIVVIDTIERGVPAKGGIRIHPNVTEEEITALAQEMSRKCTIAELPFGGGKAGIKLINMEDSNKALYGLGRELAKMEIIPNKFCAGPDLNTDCQSMDAFAAGCASIKGWRKSRLSVTGKSTGVPHELGTTSFGLIVAAERYISNKNLPINVAKASVNVEGIGEVGGNAIRHLMNKGSKITGISDTSGCVFNAESLSNYTLSKLLDLNCSIASMKEAFTDAEFSANPADLLVKPADILILASPGQTMSEEIAPQIQAKFIVEGANIAYTSKAARQIVHNSNIPSIPGIVANSGGTIASYIEWMLETSNQMPLNKDILWSMLEKEITSRIFKGVDLFTEKEKEFPELTSYEVAIKIYDIKMDELRMKDKQLRILTKNTIYAVEKTIK